MKKSDLKQIGQLMDEKLIGFATKDDLKSFATKDDLKSFATKDDLKSFATKDDLKSFATKDDLKQEVDEAVNILAITVNQNFKNFGLKINKRFNKIENKISKMLSKEEFYNYMDDKAFEVNIDKLKYLHFQELKNIPNRKIIKETLIANNL